MFDPNDAFMNRELDDGLGIDRIDLSHLFETPKRRSGSFVLWSRRSLRWLLARNGARPGLTR